ncbi:hypothetical protein [Halanaerobium salsuginis]|jgi:predicted RNase H-like nuclease|uniref:Uncharacterized protein n=1 Tax=Halanaerobium salsuginis TaxID=29563 RepID=A0A1I4N8L1_9FIRM|nr:hypothetical protein [Halanaerobium salsuginis]SFM11894.1 hypothetical protein SAMN02983006_02841 [Halanaerobium salsuginis]
MYRYFVNNKALRDGYHEVHHEICFFLKIAKSKKDLGEHENFQEAVAEAEKHYDKVKACKACCPKCYK